MASSNLLSLQENGAILRYIQQAAVADMLWSQPIIAGIVGQMILCDLTEAFMSKLGAAILLVLFSSNVSAMVDVYSGTITIE
ncbi:hypothetical protein [Halomonas huangheensis]|uniref:hypothetical protein n=1 Tax=Halomonas huangheensis TaxID=1178482 RepID=UPI0012DD8642|nr:hypothetical protein [Halomonas huangheensis]